MALALSAAIHGGVIVWAWLRPAPRSEHPRPVTPAIEVTAAPPPDVPPTTVTLLDDHTVVPAIRDLAPTARETGPKKREQAARVSATDRAPAAGTTRGGEPESGEPNPPRSSLMTMRHPKIENGPSSDFWERFEANTKPLPPKAIAGEQRDAEIAEAEGRLGNPKWIANASPDEVTAERVRLANKRYERSTAELQPDGTGKKAEHQTFTVKVAADGTVDIKDKPNIQRKGLGASFDVNDALMRRHGIDPYSSYKLQVLDDTREERYQIGKQYRTQQLAQSRQLMQRNLDRLVATARDARQLKQGLFELWDDCAETGTEELVVGGRAARSQVVGFIRTRLPAGSTDAFTASELAHLNKQRRSRATFAPYGE